MKRLLILLLLLCLPGCAGTPDRPELSVTALKVGKADAIVMLTEGRALVLDTGEQEDGEKIVEFLRSQNIHRVEALILTHFDKDHVGGADTLLRELPVDQVYLPDYQGTHREYREFLEAAEETAVPLIRVKEPVELSLGQARILVEPPSSYEIPDKDPDNNLSLITTVIHGQNRMVFLADAETSRLLQWLDGGSALACDLVKIPHHGVYDPALPQVMGALHPQYALICSSRKHPAEEETLALLRPLCRQVLETKDGDITAVSDGATLKVSQK